MAFHVFDVLNFVAPTRTFFFFSFGVLRTERISDRFFSLVGRYRLEFETQPNEAMHELNKSIELLHSHVQLQLIT